MWERCLSRGAGLGVAVLCNSGIDITQGPGVVAIRYEMVHDQRVISLDGHCTCRLRSGSMGDARGRWDGDTLVVETTNFTDGSAWASAAAGRTARPCVSSSGSRSGKDTIRYEATVVDHALDDAVDGRISADADAGLACLMRLPRRQLPACATRAQRLARDGPGSIVVS
jgi:hypothetical protein